MNPLRDGDSSNSPTPNAKKPVISLRAWIVVALLVGVLGFALGTRFSSGVSWHSNGALDYAQLDEVYQKLSERFDGELDSEKLLQGAAAGLAAATGDPYTSFFTPEEAQAFDDDLSGTFTGVGIELGQNAEQQLEVVTPLDDSPAAAAGLKPHDLITAINDENSLMMAPEKAVTKIRGEAGTTVKLTILRDGETKVFSLTRAAITVPSVEGEITNGIGYLRISRFGDDTAGLARQQAQLFKDAAVKGVILDLRGNGGGYVDAARAVASLWLEPSATIVQERRGGQTIGTERASGEAILNGVKTAVLIDSGSASASEIVAGALRDNGAAELIGVKSYGKGSVQELLPLNSGASLKVTVARWFTPSGENISGDGIKPDVEVEMTAEKFAAEGDVQRQRAVEILGQ